MFGLGGGVVQAPLMLEMGVSPPVTSATVATMTLYTSAAASAGRASLSLRFVGCASVLHQASGGPGLLGNMTSFETNS
jgi:uncharacterized membrane protein YfcA